MSIHQTSLFSLVGTRMHWLNQRQNVLAQNVANADTPNYYGRDLAPMSFSRSLRSIVAPFHIKKTQPNHIGIKSPSADVGRAGSFRTAGVRYPYEVSPDKNGVTLEEQLKKIADTQAQHNLATRLLRRYNSIYNHSIGASNG
ncbi:MAG: flagellar basal body protein [Pseudomonadota bacterium]